ncbi:RNA 2',3'-cyclic phosphodiesterase [Alteribacillus sp. HJP-4]|uniref:RNA 2',3'-cyclic phosphodiesterase n=1 Tax=Alteribacillus sp. HJP-4 TaxID=2775394 RepID=UPI0035CD0C40
MEDHYFLAVKPDRRIKEYLSYWTEENAQYLFFRKWVHPADFHITLFFLGAAEESKLAAIIKQGHILKKHTTSFHLKLEREGVFGSKKQPRILWAGVEKSAALFNLQAGVAGVCEEAGFDVETRPYRPHITLARKWDGGKQIYSETEKQLSHLESLEWKVSEFYLFRTRPKQEPKYEIVETF